MSNTKETHDSQNLCLLSFLFLAAMLIFSCSTSPLFPNFFGNDSAIFSLLGKGIVEGKELYTELFDHKGPVIFFINALGHVLGGRTGIFFLQYMSGLVSIFFLYFTGKKLHPVSMLNLRFEYLMIFICGMAIFFWTFECGNLTEEYSLPAITGSCYFFISYTTRAEDTPKHPPLYACFYGVGLATLALLRLNNAVTICFGILYIAIYLCYRKEFLNLLLNILSGFVGLAIVIIPVFSYFYRHSSFSEMIYSTFLHNFKIAANTSRASVSGNPIFYAILYSPLILSFVLLIREIICNRRINATDGLLCCVLVGNLACLWIANRYAHYFTIFSPVYIVILFKYLRFGRKSLITFAVLICSGVFLLAAARRTAANVKTVYYDKNPRYASVATDMNRIPEDEQTSVIGFNIMAADYLAGNIIPCYKYYTLQQVWSRTAPEIIADFMDWLEENEPIWVLTSYNENDIRIKNILKSKYTFKFENEYIKFYRLKQ